MKVKCPNCKGSGKILKERMNCPACLGIGKTSFTLGGKTEGEKCEKCNGTGKIAIYEKCPICNGKKEVYICKNCKKIMTSSSPSGLCQSCENRKVPAVYKLKPPIDSQLIRKEMLLLSRVDSVKKVGVFVQIAPDLNVLIRTKDVSQDYAWDIGEEVIVKITYINDQGKLFGVPVSLKEYDIKSLRGRVRKFEIKNLNKEMLGSFISINAKVVSILQTTGPTRFTLVDPTGTISGAAFIKPGERAFPEILEDMVVSVFGEITQHRETLQIEIKDFEPLAEKESKELLKKIEKAIDQKATPEQIEFSIKSTVLEKLKDELQLAAKKIRRAVYTGQPIYIRHHADADGLIAGFSVQFAVQKFMESEGYDSDTIRVRLKRLPNKPPFYDVIDITKDIAFSLEDQIRFGDKLPLFVCLDFGSSLESLLPYLQIKALDLDIIVVDHHFPDEEIKKLVDVHVNPYFVGGGYELSAGMLGFELARIIYPEIHSELQHLPAIAGLMDRVEGGEINQYLELAKEKSIELENLRRIGLAVDFELYQLKFTEGTNLIKILLGVDCEIEWHRKMYKLLSSEAERLLNTALENILPHCQKQTLENGALLITVDVELYTHRFTFPNPGKITGLVFDYFCNKNPEKSIVTLGEGPDFIILRSKGLIINFPKAVKLMQEKIPGAGVEGGGHEVVGSFKFYEGVRKKVKSFFIKYLANLELTESV
ncbi:MAG: OB-fold nucleic acid binding domain-containing protein [Candidatus Heimdallarchaeaceae archaeon]